MTRYLYRRRVVLLMTLMLGLGWSVAAATVSAVAHADPDMIALPWIQMMVGGAIAAWGGMTATLGRYLAARYDGTPFIWHVETVKDLFVSLMVGAGGYLFGAWYGRSAAEIGFLLLICGYLGARLLNVVATKLLNTVAAKQIE